MVVCSVSPFFIFCASALGFLLCGYHQTYIRHLTGKTGHFKLAATLHQLSTKASPFAPPFYIFYYYLLLFILCIYKIIIVAISRFVLLSFDLCSLFKWLAQYLITDVESSKSDCIFTLTSVLYTFVSFNIAINIFLFQLELLSAFLTTQVQYNKIHRVLFVQKHLFFLYILMITLLDKVFLADDFFLSTFVLYHSTFSWPVGFLLRGMSANSLMRIPLQITISSPPSTPTPLLLLDFFIFDF